MTPETKTFWLLSIKDAFQILWSFAIFGAYEFKSAGRESCSNMLSLAFLLTKYLYLGSSVLYLFALIVRCICFQAYLRSLRIKQGFLFQFFGISASPITLTLGIISFYQKYKRYRRVKTYLNTSRGGSALISEFFNILLQIAGLGLWIMMILSYEEQQEDHQNEQAVPACRNQLPLVFATIIFPVCLLPIIGCCMVFCNFSPNSFAQEEDQEVSISGTEDESEIDKRATRALKFVPLSEEVKDLDRTAKGADRFDYSLELSGISHNNNNNNNSNNNNKQQKSDYEKATPTSPTTFLSTETKKLHGSEETKTQLKEILDELDNIVSNNEEDERIAIILKKLEELIQKEDQELPKVQDPAGPEWLQNYKRQEDPDEQPQEMLDAIIVLLENYLEIRDSEMDSDLIDSSRSRQLITAKISKYAQLESISHA